MRSIPSLLLGGPIHDMFSGYGVACASVAKVLARMESEGLIHAEYANITSANQIEDAAKYSAMHFDAAVLFLHPSRLAIAQHANEFLASLRKLVSGVTHVYLSIVWETDPLPTHWKAVWESDLFSGFVSPSLFVLRQVQKHTPKPVYYLPHFLDTAEFPLRSEEDIVRESMFTVLYVGQHTVRKGLGDAVIAYSRALGNVPDSRCIVKYHALSDKEPPSEVYIRSLARMNTAKSTGGIYATDENIDRESLYRMYNSSSILLMPSRGEGFCLPAAEAMCSGLPVIYTDWSALCEVCEGEGNYPVAYVLDEAHSMFHYGYEGNLTYAVPLIRSIMIALVNAYSLWKKDRRAYYASVASNLDLIDRKYGYDSVRLCIDHIVQSGVGIASANVILPPDYIPGGFHE